MIAKTIDVASYLLDETGTVLASSLPELNGKVDREYDAAEFSDGIYKNEKTGRTYVYISSEKYEPLILVLDSVDDIAVKYGMVSAELIKEIINTTLKKNGRDEVFRQLLTEETNPVSIQQSVRDYRIDPKVPRCCLVIQSNNGEASKICEALISVFPKQNEDIVIEINRYIVCLIKRADEDTDMDTMLQLAGAMDETFRSEISVQACIGIGSIKNNLYDIRESYNEALEAVLIGAGQNSFNRVFLYQRLFLERFFQEIPRQTRKRFFDASYTDTLKKLLNDEMLLTVNKFFENNLNLSEAARQLFIHRNTLIYRLDKIQRVTGLDLRRFEDAVLLKVVLMLGQSLNSVEQSSDLSE